ncbi:MAG: ABC transporter substrate-binding protein [Patescibacteria group bacterium UBA2163]
MKPFQLGMIAAFALLALISITIFATFSGCDSESVGSVTIWGTVSEETMRLVFNEVRNTHGGFNGVSYEMVPADTLITNLVEAIAAGRGPDLILLPAASIGSEQDKLLVIPYSEISRRSFQDSFVEAGEIFLDERGVLGLPFYIDPYVMYWNRSLFSQAGIPRPVRYWDEFSDVAPLLSQANESGTLTQSAVALGEWGNVNHAKDIFLSLIIGLGNPIVQKNQEGEYQVTLTARGEGSELPAASALRFFTEFADPVQRVYSWNRSLPEAREAFLAGDLAVYLGKASEVTAIRASNPNLNFDIAPYPEVRGGVVAVPADLYAFSVPRGASNTSGALAAAQILSNSVAQKALVSVTGLPSVRRDVLSVSPENPYEATFRDAALNAYSFRDPNPKLSDDIFKRIVEGVSSGRFRINEALRSGQEELEELLGVQ